MPLFGRTGRSAPTKQAYVTPLNTRRDLPGETVSTFCRLRFAAKDDTRSDNGRFVLRVFVDKIEKKLYELARLLVYVLLYFI